MSVFKLKDVLIRLVLSFLLLCGIIFPFSSVTAQNYDIVIETEINEQTVKIIEINFSEDIVHFYKFDGNGNPIYESGVQVTFVPGDEDFEEYVANLVRALLLDQPLSIEANSEFSFQIYYGNLSDWEMVLQLCYDGDSDYRLYEHHELDEPFDAGSAIGDFSILFVGEETYTGYEYSIDPLNEKWNRMNTQGNNSDSIYAETKSKKGNSRTRFKVEGTTSKGRKVKIEDKGDGKGPQVYEDKNGDGDYDDEGEHITDPEEIEDIMDEVSDDLENGLGDYEGEAWDDNRTPDDTSDDIPIDAIIWFKNPDGTYSGLKITPNGSDGWDLDGKNRVSAQWMADHHYIPHGDDPNPEGAWFVGGRKDDEDDYSFEKFYDNHPYNFGIGGNTIIDEEPDDPGRVHFLIPIEDAWP